MGTDPALSGFSDGDLVRELRGRGLFVYTMAPKDVSGLVVEDTVLVHLDDDVLERAPASALARMSEGLRESLDEHATEYVIATWGDRVRQEIIEEFASITPEA